ncbi:hypothetical protein PR048_005862 [Dryococelus australis]|uniref:Uncharacterized protein n=1 Tax=Dryococelus australis TaxID=614101 RepID=A0ABQ9IAC5_9NEOP|nr:hypothetical protein PR048_005862 [Dryococelus australis]
MMSDLKEAFARVITRKEMRCAQSLIDHFAKMCFVQGLANEKVQLVVRSKIQDFRGLCDAVEAALEEESNVASVLEKQWGTGIT